LSGRPFLRSSDEGGFVPQMKAAPLRDEKV